MAKTETKKTRRTITQKSDTEQIKAQNVARKKTSAGTQKSDDMPKADTAAVTQNKASRDENYWFMVLLYFASFLVGLGVIAIIAANWQQIPTDIKLAGALAAMALNAGVLAWTVQHGKRILQQVVAVVYAFLIMGVIGLIGQIFHLNSGINNALLLWSLCSWPLLFAAPRLLWLWIPMLFAGLHFDFIDNSSWLYGSSVLWSDTIPTTYTANGILLNLFRILCIMALFCAYQWWSLKQPAEEKTVRRPLFFYSTVMMYYLFSHLAKAAIATSLSFNLWFVTANLLPCLISAAVCYWWHKKARPNGVNFMVLYLLSAVLEFCWVGILLRCELARTARVETVLPLLLLVTATGGVYKKYKTGFRFFCCILALLWWFIGAFENVWFELLPSLLLCASAAFLAYVARSRRWFNISVLAAVIRILAFYADVSDLQHAGIYLIGSGILIIAVILLLMKYGHLLWEKNNEK